MLDPLDPMQPIRAMLKAVLFVIELGFGSFGAACAEAFVLVNQRGVALEAALILLALAALLYRQRLQIEQL